MKTIWLDRIALALSLAGVFVAGVLSIGAYFQYSIPCGASHGCDVVARHWSSRALGIPNAYLGLGAYLALSILAVRRMSGRGDVRTATTISAIGALVSIVLTYIAVTVIHATCLWCLTSMALMILLLATHLARGKTEDAPDRSKLGWVVGLSMITAAALAYQGRSILVEAGDVTGLQPDPNLPLTTFIPADAHVFGDPHAPVAIVEFGDLLCPSCQAEYALIKGYVQKRPRGLRYVFRNFPMMHLEGHKQSAPAAIAAEVAADQGKFWQFLDAMYKEPLEDLPDSNPILAHAEKVGLNADATFKCMRDEGSPAFRRVLRDIKDGKTLGITVTPTFFIIAPGVKVRASTMRSLDKDIERPEYKRLYP